MTDKVETQVDVRPAEAPAESVPLAELADSSAATMTGWLAARVVLKRVRFLVVLLPVGMFIGYWDTVKNYWDKWTQPRSVAAHELEPGHEFYCPMDPQVIRSTYEPNGDLPKCPICGMPLSVRRKVFSRDKSLARAWTDAAG